jgi:hypothetical protein
LVLPFAGAGVVLQAHWWAVNSWPVALWSLGLSLLLGLVVLELGAATPGGAFAGAAITASLMFSTATFTPGERLAYAPWHSALMPVLAVFVLADISTRLGREQKLRLGTAGKNRGAGGGQPGRSRAGLRRSDAVVAGRQPMVCAYSAGAVVSHRVGRAG